MKSLRMALISAAMAVVCLPLLSKNTLVESRWTPAPVPIDADKAKWEPESFVRQKSVDVDYAFKNDASNLFCMLVFNDPKYLSSIAATGITLWVSADGKDTRNSGIHFYLKTVTPDGLIAFLESRGQTLTDERKQEIKAKSQYVVFACDLVDKKGQVTPHPGSVSGLFRSARSGKITTYEFLVPVALLSAAAGEGKWDASKPVTLGFEWGGMTNEMRRKRAGEIGDRNARATSENSDFAASVRGGGESAGARTPSGSFEGMQRGPQKHDFWLELTIAREK